MSCVAPTNSAPSRKYKQRHADQGEQQPDGAADDVPREHHRQGGQARGRGDRREQDHVQRLTIISLLGQRRAASPSHRPTRRAVRPSVRGQLPAVSIRTTSADHEQRHTTTALEPAPARVSTDAGHEQLPEAHAEQQHAGDRQEVLQAGHHHLVDPQPRQRPAHPHHHEHQEPALDDEHDDVEHVPEPARAARTARTARSPVCQPPRNSRTPPR